MKAKFALALVIVLFSTTTTFAQKLKYPETRKGDVVEDYHGTKVADPYRWLEDLDSEETRAWVVAQNKVTFSWLDQIPEREMLKKRLTKLWNYPKYGVPFKHGKRYFYTKNDGLQNQSVYYMVKSLKDENPQVLIDPNKLSEDGTVALTTMAFSKDGKKLVYGTSASGSDWRTFRVHNVETGEDYDDVIEWVKFSGASWQKSGRGFFYSRYDKPKEGDAYEQMNKNQKLYYHKLGTKQDDDVLIYERPDDPDLGFAASVTDDGQYLAISVWKGTDRRNRFYYLDTQDENPEVVRLLDDFDASYQFVGNTGREFYFITDLDAPNKRLIAIDIAEPERDVWVELIPESKAVLQWVTIINNQFVVNALDDVKSRLTIHELDGSFVKEIALPAIGSVGGLSGEREDREMFYAFTSFTYPTTIFRYDFKSGISEVFRQPEINFDASQYETKQVFYESKDGTRVPMFIVHKKGIKMDGANPTYLYAYGGFNISITPSFSISNLAWLEQGGIYAVPNLRGGGEYGEEWHAAGMLKKKQNVFDDFIAAAEYLIREGYTSTPKLAIAGGSNGGLLTGACVTQRPDLYGAAIVAVGVLDMLRYHKFTIGWAWASEYGSSDNPEH
ncbi:MAG: prolyl oligopeptidase family protein, partial [bacterium]